MLTKVQKWGNSLALRIPKAFATEAGLENEALVEVTLENGWLLVKPVAPPEWTLEKLLSGVTKENLHREVDFGTPMGKESW